MKKRITSILTAVFMMATTTLGFVSVVNADSYATTADIQQRLNAAGFSVGTVDGILGARTEAAIRSFQAANGLLVDGIVGPATQAALWNVPATAAVQQTTTTTNTTTTTGTAASTTSSTAATAAVTFSTAAASNSNAYGYDVAEIQQRLQAAGFVVGIIDGILGEKTQLAIMNFQAAAGLKVDGIVGPATMAALGGTTAVSTTQTTTSSQQTSVTQQTSTGSIVYNTSNADDTYTLQQRLTAYGYSVGTIDGIYGVRTDAAVRAFQAANGLTVDGIAGPATMAALGLN